MKRSLATTTAGDAAQTREAVTRAKAGWPLIAPRHAPPRLLRYCAASRGPKYGMNGCLLDLFGQKLSWRARSEPRLRCQIGRCQHSSHLQGTQVRFFLLPFYSSSGAVKVYPRKPPSDSRKLQLKVTMNKPTKHRSPPPPPGNCGTVAFLPAKKGTPGSPCIGTGDQGRKTLNSARGSGSTI